MASQTNGHEARRPSAASRYPTAPGVGDAPTKEQYEHGIQVIDEEKVFKYAWSNGLPVNLSCLANNVPVLT
jgi:hypothetical protein